MSKTPAKEVTELPEDDSNGTNRRRSSRIATRRASSTAEDTPVKATRGRRTSASQESVGSFDEDVISSSQNEPSTKPRVSTRSTKSPARLNKTSDEVKGTPKITRNRGSISSNDDIKNEVVTNLNEVTTRRQSLRAASTSPTSDAKPTTSRVNTPRKSSRAVSTSPTRSEVAAKSTPSKRGRRGSVTERLVPLEAIEETENKKESATKDSNNDEVDDDVFLSKKKKAVVVFEKKQNLQPITEKSFSEEDSENSSAADKEKNLLQEELSKEIVIVSDTEEGQKRSPKRSGDKLDSPKVKPKEPRISLSLKKSDDAEDELSEEKELKVVLAMMPEKESSKKTPEKISDSENKKTPQKASNSEKTIKTPSSEETKKTRKTSNSEETRESPNTLDCSVVLTNAFVKNSATTSQSNVQKGDSTEQENLKQVDLNISGSSDSSNKENKKDNEMNGKENGKTEDRNNIKKRESIRAEPMEVEEFPQDYNYAGNENIASKKSVEPEFPKFVFATPEDEVTMNCFVEINEEFKKHKHFNNHEEVIEAKKIAEDRVYAKMGVTPPSPRRSPRLVNQLNGDVEAGRNTTTPTKRSILKSNENLNKSLTESDKKDNLKKSKLLEETQGKSTTGDKDSKQGYTSEELISDIEFNLSEDEESPTTKENKTEELNKSLSSNVKDKTDSSKLEVDLEDETEPSKESLIEIDNKDKSQASASSDSPTTLADNLRDEDNHVKTSQKNKRKSESNSEEHLEKEKPKSSQYSVSSEDKSIEEEIIEDSDEGSKSQAKTNDEEEKEEQTISSSNKTSPEVQVNPKSSTGSKQVNEDDEKEADVANMSKIEKRKSKEHRKDILKTEEVDSANTSKVESHTKEADEEQKIENSTVESDELNSSSNRKKKDKKRKSSGNTNKAETEPEEEKEDDIQTDKKSLKQQKSSLEAENMKGKEDQEVMLTLSPKETDEVNTSKRKSKSDKNDSSDDDQSGSDFEFPIIKVTKAKSQKQVTNKISEDDVDSENDKEETDLDAKIANLIERQLNEDSDSDESSEASVTHFLDDLAEEGEEDTPSEDSNAIIDEGESIGSSDTQESDSANTYDDEDSFLDDDNDYTELLSGEEYDLADEKETKKKKRKRIKVIEVSDSEEEVKGKKSPSPKIDKPSVKNKLEIDEAKRKLEKLKGKAEDDSDLDKMSTRPYCGLTPPSAISIRDSLSDTEKIEIKDDDSSSNLVINKEDNLKSLEELRQDVPAEETVATEKAPENIPEIHISTATPTVFTPNNSLMTNQTPQSESTRKRLSSITIQENIKLQDIEDGTVCDRIVKVIDVFCSSVKGEQKDNTGNISLNISVEYLNDPIKGAENDLENLKKNLSQEFDSKATDKLDENTESVQIEEPILAELQKENPLKRKSPAGKGQKSLTSDDETPKIPSSKKKKKQRRSFEDIGNELPATSTQSQSLVVLSDNESNLSGDLDKELHKKYFTASLEDLVDIEAEEVTKKDKKSDKSKKLKVVEKIEQKTNENDESIKKPKKLKRKAISIDQVDEIEHEVQQTSPLKKDKKSRKARNKRNNENIADFQEESKKDVEETTQLEEHSKEKKTKKSSRSSLIPFKEESSKPGLLPSRFFNTVTTVEMKPDKKKPKILPSTSTDKKSWEVANLDITLLPSSSSIKRKANPVLSFHVKDFKNQMLYDTSRVPRVDTKVMLKKSQKMKY